MVWQGSEQFVRRVPIHRWVAFSVSLELCFCEAGDEQPITSSHIPDIDSPSNSCGAVDGLEVFGKIEVIEFFRFLGSVNEAV